ncbi:matrix metalloproteinase-25-like [Branchiostoma lanceolatum]|uniref:matrix metalloproteinase-25-like n=1 Tax=Branchiostoma lanceolatum TaxID=7740 RepID=UPI0034551BBD
MNAYVYLAMLVTVAFGCVRADITTQQEKLQSKDSMREDISTFQESVNITMTGQLDADTVRVKQIRFCGVPDTIPGTNLRRMARRHRRFRLHAFRWNNRNLTWRLTVVEGAFNRSELEEVMTQAYQVWQEQTPLTFTKVDGSPAFEIQFVIPDPHGNHGDNAPFTQGTLAHAFSPGIYALNGDVHFNGNKDFSIGRPAPAASKSLPISLGASRIVFNVIVYCVQSARTPKIPQEFFSALDSIQREIVAFQKHQEVIS